MTTRAKGAIDIKICPFNSNIISYVLEDNLWIQDLISKTEIQLTHTAAPVKSGVPSYAVQEEFNRYSGYWWYPTNQFNEDGSATYRLVYEETDESSVEMTYITPSCTGDDSYDEYRYPRVGTPNSKVFLKMIEFTVPVDPTVSAVSLLTSTITIAITFVIMHPLTGNNPSMQSFFVSLFSAMNI